MTFYTNAPHFSVTRKGSFMSDQKYRTLDEWYALVQECRRSGFTDAQWCLARMIRGQLYSSLTCDKAIDLMKV